MQVDFYQLAGEAVEAVLPQLAGKCLAIGERLLVVAGEDDLRARLSRALWESRSWEGRDPCFLAHGESGGAHDSRQPILLAGGVTPANGARFLALADGLWRDVLDAAGDRAGVGGFARVFLLFDEATVAGARTCWRALGARPDIVRRYWRRRNGRWAEGP